MQLESVRRQLRRRRLSHQRRPPRPGRRPRVCTVSHGNCRFHQRPDQPPERRRRRGGGGGSGPGARGLRLLLLGFPERHDQRLPRLHGHQPRPAAGPGALSGGVRFLLRRRRGARVPAAHGGRDCRLRPYSDRGYVHLCGGPARSGEPGVRDGSLQRPPRGGRVRLSPPAGSPPALGGRPVRSRRGGRPDAGAPTEKRAARRQSSPAPRPH